MSQPMKKKYVAHKVLREGSVYASVSDSDNVVVLKPVISKISRVQDATGKPANNPDGTPQYFIEWNGVVTTLTAEEWRVHKEMEDRSGV